MNQDLTQKVDRLISDAQGRLINGQIDSAMELVMEAKATKIGRMGLDVVRAKCFLAQGKLGCARESLKEELRLFPYNSEASNLLSEVSASEDKGATNYGPQEMLNDTEFQQILKQVRPFSMLPDIRLYNLFLLAKYVCLKNISGNFIECGVAGGGSCALIAKVAATYSQIPRLVFACDSYEGLPSPGNMDKLNGTGANDLGWGAGTCAAPEDFVMKSGQVLGVSNIIVPVKGYFEATLPTLRITCGNIALLHSDCDWYESTLTVLTNLYDNITPGGAIQLDDYGYWDGVKLAVDDFQRIQSLNLTIQNIDGGSAYLLVE